MGESNKKLERNVLILNQTYEPLHICDVKKAITLILKQKAILIKSFDNQFIYTVSSKFPVPSIIRIQQHVRIQSWAAILTKSNILKRDQHTCQYCGSKNVPLTIDHVIPKVLGGKETWTNLVTACIKCNNKKGDRTPEQAGMKLINRPKKPHRIHTLQRFVDSPIDEWKPYLFLD